MTKRTLDEQGFRELVRKIVSEQLDDSALDEYVANDEGNPHKDVHADPTGRNWDSGLDEEDAAAKRRLIAQASSIQKQLDPRPRCEECGRVLTRRDFLSYWDGDPDLEREYAVPRICDDCADQPHMAEAHTMGEAAETHGPGVDALCADVEDAWLTMALLNKITPFSRWYKGDHGKARARMVRACKALFAALAGDENPKAAELRRVLKGYVAELVAKSPTSGAWLHNAIDDFRDPTVVMDEDDLTQYVANDDENPHKKVHADPSGRNWDSGLEEADGNGNHSDEHVLRDVAKTFVSKFIDTRAYRPSVRKMTLTEEEMIELCVEAMKLTR
jgi:hypothetical protein